MKIRDMKQLADDIEKLKQDTENLEQETGLMIAEHLKRPLQFIVRASQGSCNGTPLCVDKAPKDRDPLCLSCEAKEIIIELLESGVLALAPVAIQDEPERPPLPKPPDSNYK